MKEILHKNKSLPQVVTLATRLKEDLLQKLKMLKDYSTISKDIINLNLEIMTSEMGSTSKLLGNNEMVKDPRFSLIRKNSDCLSKKSKDLLKPSSSDPKGDLLKRVLLNRTYTKNVLLLTKMESEVVTSYEEKKVNPDRQIASEVSAILRQNKPELKENFEYSVVSDDNQAFLFSTMPLNQKNLIDLIEEENAILNLFIEENKKGRLNCSFMEELCESHIFEDDPRQSVSQIIENSLENHQDLKGHLGNRSNSIDLTTNAIADDSVDSSFAKQKKYIFIILNSIGYQSKILKLLMELALGPMEKSA